MDLTTTLDNTDDVGHLRGPRPEDHLMLAFECGRPLAGGARYALEGISEVVFGRGAARGVQRKGARLEVRVPDPRISTTHAWLRRGAAGWHFEDAGSRNGSAVNGVPVRKAQVRDGDLLELGRTFFYLRQALPTRDEDPRVVDSAEVRPLAPGLLTLLPSLRAELDALARVAPTTVPVVLRGESGTGKEVMARALHALSRRPGELVAVNCGALPANLIETELFGYKKGAFSGAGEDRAGLVRAADRGTLFLDEIGDLPAVSQAAFLRVLQEAEVTPVGATRAIKVDLRLVTATHRDLEAGAAAGSFRADLLARISGVTVQLPPLRERREDLGLLIGELLRKLAGPAAEQVGVSRDAARALFRHAWPLNVRELERTLAGALALADGKAIEVEHLPPALRVGLPPAAAEPVARPEPLDDEQRKRELVRLLETHAGNLSEVARGLKTSRVQVRRLLKRYQIDPACYR